MDDKDIQSAFAHLLEAVADRVAVQAAQRARGEISEDEFVNSVLETVQRIAPDATLPVKPGEFTAPATSGPLAPSQEDGPLSPLMGGQADEEEEADASGSILNWILARKPAEETLAADAERDDTLEVSPDPAQAGGTPDEEDGAADVEAAPPLSEDIEPEPWPKSFPEPEPFTDALAPPKTEIAQPDAESVPVIEPEPWTEPTTSPSSPVAEADASTPLPAADSEPASDSDPEPVPITDGEPRSASTGVPETPPKAASPLWDLEDSYTGGPMDASGTPANETPRHQAAAPSGPGAPVDADPPQATVTQDTVAREAPAQGEQWENSLPGAQAAAEALAAAHTPGDTDATYPEETLTEHDATVAVEEDTGSGPFDGLEDEPPLLLEDVVTAQLPEVDANDIGTPSEAALSPEADQPYTPQPEEATVMDAEEPPAVLPDSSTPKELDDPALVARAPEQESPNGIDGILSKAARPVHQKAEDDAPSPPAADGAESSDAGDMPMDTGLSTQGMDTPAQLADTAAGAAPDQEMDLHVQPEKSSVAFEHEDISPIGDIQKTPSPDMDTDASLWPDQESARPFVDTEPSALGEDASGATTDTGLDIHPGTAGADWSADTELPTHAAYADDEERPFSPTGEPVSDAPIVDDDMESPAPADPDGDLAVDVIQMPEDKPLLIDQEWQPDEDDPLAGLPSPPDPFEPKGEPYDTIEDPAPVQSQETDSGREAAPLPEDHSPVDDDPFHDLPVPPHSTTGTDDSIETDDFTGFDAATKEPASAPPQPQQTASRATATATAQVKSGADLSGGPRIYTPQSSGAAEHQSDAAKAAPHSSSPQQDGSRVLVSGSAQWERDDSHTLEDTMFRLGVDEELAGTVLTPTDDMGRRERDFITKETRRALKDNITTKSPSTAFLLSLLLPGFGNAYAGNPLGILFALPALAVGIFFGLGQMGPRYALIGYISLSVIAALTAYVNATEHNRRSRIKQAQQPLRKEQRESTLKLKM